MITDVLAAHKSTTSRELKSNHDLRDYQPKHQSLEKAAKNLREQRETTTLASNTLFFSTRNIRT